MKRLFFTLLAAAASACSSVEPSEFRQTFESAQLAMWRGDLMAAQSLVDRGIGGAASATDTEEIWRLRLLRAEILLARLQLTQAESILRADVPPGDAFDDLRARRQYLLSKLNVAQGRLEPALALLDTAGQFARVDSDVELDAAILGGQIRFRLGQSSEAERGLRSAFDRARRKGDRFRQVLALNNIGMGHLVRGRYDAAAEWFEKALSYRELSGMTAYATALYNAGICYSRLGQFERAVHAQRRAVEFYERGGPTLQLVQSLGSLGTTYWRKGDTRQSIAFLQRAYDVATEGGLVSEVALWSGNLATAHAELQNWDDAERFNREARRTGANSRSIKPVYFTLTDAQIAAGRGDVESAGRLFDEALAKAEDSVVRWTANAGIAHMALAAKQPARAARHFEAALAEIEHTRSGLLRTEFRLSFLTQLIEFYQAYVDALMDQGNIDRALEIAESSRGRVLAERHGVQPAGNTRATAMRAVARDSGAVLLSYWLAPTRSFVWVVSGGGIRGAALPPSPEIESLVRDHQAMIDNTLADPLANSDSPGGRLYDVLVAPVSKWIPENAQVVVVPDGALHRLNFETLPVRGARRHYWIEDVEIQVAPTLTLLSRNPASTRSDRSLLLIGDPAPHEPQFPSLRYASAEMTGIAKHFARGRVATFERDNAVPAAFRNAKPDSFGMIHFTAHASANSESPLDSAVILSGPDHAFKLYARDVADQLLHAELVTVSACRSAGERTYSGEGLIGFAWAFLRAGSQRVVAGLWDVNDRSTADLMERMYRQIAAGDAPPRALREAKLSFIRNGGTFAKPYYWGPFEMFTVVL